MSTSTFDLSKELWKVANFYDEFLDCHQKIATLLHDASNIVLSLSRIIDKNDELKHENAKLCEENERLTKLNTSHTINTDVLKQYSKEQIVELAMYWYEEAVYCENKYEELQRKIKEDA